MADPHPKDIEEWSEFQKRVFAAEKYHGHGFLPSIRAGSVITIILGMLFVLLYKYAVRLLLIYNLGAILIGLGLVCLLIIYWVNAGSKVVKKEREKMIQERGMTKRCKYLEGDLPDALSPRSGKCNLYEKNLTTYPYCIYCKSHITLKQEEETKLKIKIK